MVNIAHTATIRIIFYSAMLGTLISCMTDMSAMGSPTELTEAVEEEQKSDVEQEADVWECEKTHRSPGFELSLALAHDNLKFVAAAIAKGANVNQSDFRLRIMPPLVKAIINDCSPQIIDLLLDHKANPNLKDYSGRTILHVTALLDSTNIIINRESCYLSYYVQALIRADADINAVDHDGNTPLHLATSWFLNSDAVADLPNIGVEIPSLLINAKANPFILNNRRISVLQQVMRGTYVEIEEEEEIEEVEEALEKLEKDENEEN